MDSKDFQLLAALHKNARQSYHSLGRAVSLSAPAVRERLKRLEANGVLKGYGLWMEPGLFNREEVLVFFAKERSTKEVLKVLASRDVSWIGWKLEGGLTVGLWTKNLGRSISDLKELLSEEPTGHAATGLRRVRPPSSLDWTMIHVLIDDPTISLGELIRMTGLSPKTVRKHLVKLFDSETLVIIPRLGTVEGSGELVYQLAVSGPATVSNIRDVIPDAVLLHQTRNPPMNYLLCRSSDLSDVSLKTKALRRLPGVETAVLSLNKELLFSKEFSHALVHMQQEMKAQAT